MFFAASVGSGSAFGTGTANTGIAGVTSGEASVLARQIYGIEANGQRAVSSVEAFGSRAGSTFRGRGSLPTSDLDIRITLSDPAHFGAVNAEMAEIEALFQSTKGFPLQSTYVIPGLPPPTLLQTPFILLQP
jgi:predicted nucleotidyltransferase